MLQCLNQRHFLLDVFVFALSLLHVFDVQLDHLDRYQLSSVRQAAPHLQVTARAGQLASYLIYAQALLEYVLIIMWLRSVIKVLPFVKFAEDKVFTFLILREKC